MHKQRQIQFQVKNAEKLALHALKKHKVKVIEPWEKDLQSRNSCEGQSLEDLNRKREPIKGNIGFCDIKPELRYVKCS